MDPTQRNAPIPDVKISIPEKKVSKNKNEAISSQQKKIGQSHEAPELRKSPIKAIRRLSTGDLRRKEGSTLDETKKAISEHSGELWTCTDRIPTETGGYIYKFKLKDEFDDVTPHPAQSERSEAAKAAIKTMYPAIEKSGSEIKELDSKLTNETLGHLDERVEELFQNLLKSDNLSDRYAARAMPDLMRKELRDTLDQELQLSKTLNELGYERKVTDQGVFLFIPDRQTLLTRWENLREKKPHLPRIEIALSEGIADNMAFVEAYLTNDALLSEGKEFIHDQLVHIIPTLSTMLSVDKMDVSREKFNLVMLIAKEYRTIMLIKKELEDGQSPLPKKELEIVKNKLIQLETSLGALVDTISSKSDLKSTQQTFIGSYIPPFETIWRNQDWNDFFTKRFADENFDLNSLRVAAEQMQNLISDYYRDFETK